MKLTIRCASIAGKKQVAEIIVECSDETTISELKDLLAFEHWLNEHTNARFHILLEDE